jgi:hypothetical protein
MRWLRDALASRLPQLRFAYFNPSLRSSREHARSGAGSAKGYAPAR